MNGGGRAGGSTREDLLLHAFHLLTSTVPDPLRRWKRNVEFGMNLITRYREFRKRRSVRLWRAEFAARGIDVSRLSDDEVERRVTDGCKRLAERLRCAGLSPEECADVMEGVAQGKLR